MTPCFPRFNGDYHGGFIKELCDNTSTSVSLSVLAPRTRTLGKIDARYPVNRFPYMSSQRQEYLPEGTMKDAPPSQLLELPFYLCAAYRHLMRGKTDLIHAHLAIPMGFVASLTTRPTIVTCHGSDLTLPFDNPRYRQFTEYTLRKATKIVTVSRYLQKIALRLGASPKKTSTVYLGVDTGHYKPGNKKNILTIGTLGRLVEKKNIEDLLRATQILQDKYDFHLRIGGDGQRRVYLETLSTKLGLKSCEFCGQVSNPLEFHRSLDVFVLCSTREGLSLALQEAMACGATPVTVDACGCNEIISHGENGYMYKARSVPDLVMKLESAINYRLGREARQTILHGFDSKKNSEKYIELYQKVGYRF